MNTTFFSHPAQSLFEEFTQGLDRLKRQRPADEIHADIRFLESIEQQHQAAHLKIARKDLRKLRSMAGMNGAPNHRQIEKFRQQSVTIAKFCLVVRAKLEAEVREQIEQALK